MSKRNLNGEFCAITDRMIALYEKKNRDYGSAFTEEVKESGWGYATGLLGNKVRRVKNLLLKTDKPEVNESIEDTLVDLANYTIMTLMEVRASKALEAQEAKRRDAEDDEDSVEAEE